MNVLPPTLTSLEFLQQFADRRVTLSLTHQSVGILIGALQLTGGSTHAQGSTNSICFNYQYTVAIQRSARGRRRWFVPVILLACGALAGL
jgi:hypothetical protein